MTPRENAPERSSGVGNEPTRDPALTPPEGASPSPPTAPLPDMPELSIGPSTGSAQFSRAEPPKLDGYQVLDPIGEGGMGTVWRGIQDSTRRPVAIKLISAAGFGSDRARQRFDREVEITARLEHPNIARVYDSGLNRGVYFYAMELIDGVPLDQYAANKELDRDSVLRLFATICRAVDYAHSRGVIHRDLKPGNILVTADGQPHVLDFGLAKALLDANVESGISIAGEVAGTPGYMSPEQAAGRGDLDGRCDVYSLGVILYRLLTGDTPHDLSGTYLDILHRISNEEPKRPRRVDPTLDRELEALLLHALQRDSTHRYKSAGELAQDIDNFLSGDPLKAKTPTVFYFLKKRVRKHRVKLIVVLTVLVLAGMSVLLVLRLDRAAALKDLADGDELFQKNDFDGAAAHYQSALKLSRITGLSPLPAQLGLWDVKRSNPLIWSTPLFQGTGAKPVIVDGALAISTVEHKVIAGCEDGVIRLWNLDNGQFLGSLASNQGSIRGLFSSPDTSFALSGSADGVMRYWDLKHGTLAAEFPVTTAPGSIKRVALSPGSRYAAAIVSYGRPTGSTQNDNVTVFDVASGRPVCKTDANHLRADGEIAHLAFSSNGSRLIASGANITTWSLPDGKEVDQVVGPKLAAAVDRRDFATAAGGSDGTIGLLHGPTNPDLKASAAIVALATTSHGWVAGSEDGSFLGIGFGCEKLWSLPPRGQSVVAISSDGNLGLTAPDDGNGDLRLWRLAEAAGARAIVGFGPYYNAQLSDDGRIALAGRGLLDVSSSEPAFPLHWVEPSPNNLIEPPNWHTDAIAAMSADGRRVAFVRHRQLVLEDFGEPTRRIETPIEIQHPGQPQRTPIALRGQTLALPGKGYSVELRSVSDLKPTESLSGHSGPISSIRFSGDASRLITCSEDQTAKVWDPSTGKLIATLVGHSAPINSGSLSWDGRIAATASGAGGMETNADNTVRIWQVDKATPPLVIPLSSRVRSVALSADGRVVAAGDQKQNVTLFDAATGQVIRVIASHCGVVVSLKFDRSGTRLLCGGDALCLWDFGATGKD